MPSPLPPRARWLCAFSAALVVLGAPLSCRSTSPPSPPPSEQRDPSLDPSLSELELPPITPEAGSIRVIHTVDWPAGPWGISLVGVDVEARHAVLLLKDPSKASPQLAVDLVSLQSGELIERWNADEALARTMVLGYPGFRGFQKGLFFEDLRRYAELLRGVGQWSHREASPPLGVIPNPLSQDVVLGRQPDDGTDGDWLMALGAGDETLTRVDRGLRASYNPSFSPDGSAIAWIGGSVEFARPGRQIGYVLRLATAGDYKHVALPGVSELLRTPVWSKDSSMLYAIGASGRQECLYAVEVSHRAVKELFCHASNFDLMLSPDTSRALLLLHPPPGGDQGAQRLVTLDLKSGELLISLDVRDVQGMGPFGVWLDPVHFGLLTDLGRSLTLLHSVSGEELATFPLGDEQGIIRGRHGMLVVEDELIALRQSVDAQSAELVAISLR